MPMSDEAVLWAVYRVNIEGKAAGVNVVCEQGEWDQLELAHPGRYTLVRSGIPSEAEAERLARGTSGDPRLLPPAAREQGVAADSPARLVT
jgi:hypothetical protein